MFLLIFFFFFFFFFFFVLLIFLKFLLNYGLAIILMLDMRIKLNMHVVRALVVGLYRWSRYKGLTMYSYVKSMLISKKK